MRARRSRILVNQLKQAAGDVPVYEQLRMNHQVHAATLLGQQPGDRVDQEGHVVCDDLDLPTGRLRFRASGSAGGQKGLADIIRHLGTDSVARLRIGIDRPPAGWDPADYVLGKFAPEEQEQVELAIDLAARAAIEWSTQGIGFVMNRYNADPTSKKKNKDRKKVGTKETTKSDPAPSDGEVSSRED